MIDDDQGEEEARLPIPLTEELLSLSDHRSAISLRDSLNMLTIYAAWGIAWALLAIGAPAVLCLGVIPSVFGAFSIARTYRERRRDKISNRSKP